jgi:hypothetical protein
VRVSNGCFGGSLGAGWALVKRVPKTAPKGRRFLQVCGYMRVTNKKNAADQMARDNTDRRIFVSPDRSSKLRASLYLIKPLCSLQMRISSAAIICYSTVMGAKSTSLLASAAELWISELQPSQWQDVLAVSEVKPS